MRYNINKNNEYINLRFHRIRMMLDSYIFKRRTTVPDKYGFGSNKWNVDAMKIRWLASIDVGIYKTSVRNALMKDINR